MTININGTTLEFRKLMLFKLVEDLFTKRHLI